MKKDSKVEGHFRIQFDEGIDLLFVAFQFYFSRFSTFVVQMYFKMQIFPWKGNTLLLPLLAELKGGSIIGQKKPLEAKTQLLRKCEAHQIKLLLHAVPGVHYGHP